VATVLAARPEQKATLPNVYVCDESTCPNSNSWL